MFLGYIPQDSFAELAKPRHGLLPMESAIGSTPISAQLASVEHICRMFDQPCHHRVIVRESTFDPLLSGHLERPDLVNNFPHGSFR